MQEECKNKIIHDYDDDIELKASDNKRSLLIHGNKGN